MLSSFQRDTSSVAQRGWERFASFPLRALCVRSFLTLTCFYVFTCGHSEMGMFSMSSRPPGLSSGVFGWDEPDGHLGVRYCCLIKRCHAQEHVLAGQSVWLGDYFSWLDIFHLYIWQSLLIQNSPNSNTRLSSQEEESSWDFKHPVTCTAP